MLDIDANRRARKWTRKQLALRQLWSIAYILFRFSPRVLWGWRRMLLRRFGAAIGSNVHIYPTVRITIPWNLSVGDYSAVGDGVIIYSLGPVEIGSSVTVSQGAHLCAGTHNYADKAMPLIKSSIKIGSGAWICADAFIGPDVVIGDYAIVGARGVVVRDVEEKYIVAGNPAKPIGRR